MPTVLSSYGDQSCVRGERTPIEGPNSVLVKPALRRSRRRLDGALCGRRDAFGSVKGSGLEM